MYQKTLGINCFVCILITPIMYLSDKLFTALEFGNYWSNSRSVACWEGRQLRLGLGAFFLCLCLLPDHDELPAVTGDHLPLDNLQLAWHFPTPVQFVLRGLQDGSGTDRSSMVKEHHRLCECPRTIPLHHIQVAD